jgi:hypothetical protein
MRRGRSRSVVGLFCSALLRRMGRRGRRAHSRTHAPTHPLPPNSLPPSLPPSLPHAARTHVRIHLLTHSRTQLTPRAQLVRLVTARAHELRAQEEAERARPLSSPPRPRTAMVQQSDPVRRCKGVEGVGVYGVGLLRVEGSGFGVWGLAHVVVECRAIPGSDEGSPTRRRVTHVRRCVTDRNGL